MVTKSKTSHPKDVGEPAVPQGSLLGPILFIIFYNDFPEVRNEGSSIIYADDDTDNVSSNDPNILQQKIQREADLSTSWVKDNKLVCSGKKTKLLIVGTKELRKPKLINQDISIKINVDGHEVKESESERLLGILMNNKMTWEHHLYGNDEYTDSKAFTEIKNNLETLKDYATEKTEDDIRGNFAKLSSNWQFQLKLS